MTAFYIIYVVPSSFTNSAISSSEQSSAVQILFSVLVSMFSLARRRRIVLLSIPHFSRSMYVVTPFSPLFPKAYQTVSYTAPHIDFHLRGYNPHIRRRCDHVGLSRNVSSSCTSRYSHFFTGAAGSGFSTGVTVPNFPLDAQKSQPVGLAFLVPRRGFEPRTPCLKGRCSAD